MITFANSLGPAQTVGARSGSKLFDTLVVFLKDILEKVALKKKFGRLLKKHAKLPNSDRFLDVCDYVAIA